MTSALLFEAKKYASKNLLTVSVRLRLKTNDKKYVKSCVTWKDDCIPKEFDQSHTADCTGLALITGKISGIIGLDIDNVDHWNSVKTSLNMSSDPVTPTQRSQSGGMHMFFKQTPEVDNLKNRSNSITLNGKKLDIDLRTDGGLIIIAPSFMENFPERKYEWIEGGSLEDVELMNMPANLIALIESSSGINKRKANSEASGPAKVTKKETTAGMAKLFLFFQAKFPELKNQLKDTEFDQEHKTILIPTESKTCPFVKHDHNSNHVYILIRNQKEMVKKCHCEEAATSLTSSTVPCKRLIDRNGNLSLVALLKRLQGWKPRS
jgi:hypothetical protein